MKPTRNLLSTLSTLALTVGVISSSSAALFSFTPLDAPESQGTVAQDINNQGVAVGEFATADLPVRRAFLLSRGQYLTVVVPGTLRTGAHNINNIGDMVGYFRDPIRVFHGFLLHQGVFSPINPPNAKDSFANGINDSGGIVGEYTDASGVSHGFLLSGGTFTAIDVPGAKSTTANDINNAGVIVGTFVDSSGKDRSYIRNVDGSFSPLDVPGAAGTRVEGGINNHGDIVGDFDDSKGNTHGFLFHDGSFTTVDVPGAKASFAIGINDLGVIAGAFDPSAPNQFRRGFLAEPIPEPATLLSLCVGLAASIGMARLRQRRR